MVNARTATAAVSGVTKCFIALPPFSLRPPVHQSRQRSGQLVQLIVHSGLELALRLRRLRVEVVDPIVEVGSLLLPVLDLRLQLVLDGFRSLAEALGHLLHLLFHVVDAHLRRPGEGVLLLIGLVVGGLFRGLVAGTFSRSAGHETGGEEDSQK
jgi:hypothetical protein